MSSSWKTDPAYPAPLWDKLERYHTAAKLQHWYLRPWIPFGVIVLLVAQNKTGKSTWIMDMLTAQIFGMPFLGKTLPRVPVLYVTEQSDASFAMQLANEGLHWPGVPFDVIFRFELFGKPWTTMTAMILERVRETGIRLVILDTWSGLSGFPEGGENDTSLVRQYLDALLPITAEGCTVLISAHQGHVSKQNAPRRPGTAARGATGLGDGVDQAIWLQMPSRGRSAPPRGIPEPGRTLWAEGRFPGVPDGPVACVRVPNCQIPSTYIGTNVPRTAPNWFYQKDLDAISGEKVGTEMPGIVEEGQDYTLHDFTVIFGCSERTAMRRVSAMPGVQRSGAGTRRSPYRYVVPYGVSKTLDCKRKK